MYGGIISQSLSQTKSLDNLVYMGYNTEQIGVYY
jgi:hypothetical protein